MPVNGQFGSDTIELADFFSLLIAMARWRWHCTNLQLIVISRLHGDGSAIESIINCRIYCIHIAHASRLSMGVECLVFVEINLYSYASNQFLAFSNL